MLTEIAITKKKVADSIGEKIKSSGLNDDFINDAIANPIATMIDKDAIMNFK